jgi:hypothetical protein
MLTDAEAAPDFGSAAHSAPSFNTATCCFTERYPGTAANSADTSHTAADAYRLAAPNSGTSAVSINAERPTPNAQFRVRVRRWVFGVERWVLA